MTSTIAALEVGTRQRCQALIIAAGTEGMAVEVASSSRTCAEQNAYYAQGRTTPGPIVTYAEGCMSWHVVRRAFDLTPRAGATVNWQLLGALGKALGLTWGGDFPGKAGQLHDVGHFEWRDGQPIEAYCPDPSGCTDVAGDAPTAGDWETSGCSSAQWRLWSDARFEFDTGFPKKKLPSKINDYAPLVWKYSRQYGLPAAFVAGEIGLESGGDTNAGSSAGASGLMQLLPSTASYLAGRPVSAAELKADPDLNVRLGCQLLGKLLKSEGGNFCRVAFAYNCGSAKCGSGWCNKPDGSCGPNRWSLHADCTKDAQGNWQTLDYFGIVAGYANAAAEGLFAPPGPIAEIPWTPAPPEPLPAPPPPPGPAPPRPDWALRPIAAPSMSRAGVVTLWTAGGLVLGTLGAIAATRARARHAA